MKKQYVLLTICCFLTTQLGAQELILFDTSSWKLEGAEVTTFHGRNALKGGAAELKDFVFENGTIETDIWVDGSRSFPGIVFRKQSEEDFETFYIRPHKSGQDDAVQYTPCFNGETCWQLHFGKGNTASVNIPQGEWIHMKLNVNGDMAEFFMDNMESPVVTTEYLAHGISKGSVSLTAGNENIYFSNFRITKNVSGFLPIERTSFSLKGNVTMWEISKTLPVSAFRNDTYPAFSQWVDAQWQEIKPERNGLINISRYRKNDPGPASCIYARTLLYSDADKPVKMAFGYSDAIKIFLNKKIIYSGNYGFRSRGLSFSGTVGLYDTLFMDLRKGLNELFLISAETFGGWGFIFNSNVDLENENRKDDALTKLWESPTENLYPESTLFDSVRNVIYYSNFDQSFSKNKNSGYITRLDLNGKVLTGRWADSIDAPTGMCYFRDKLYAAERNNLVEIDINSGKIMKRYPYPADKVFANDIASDPSGNIYITNSTPNHGISDIFIFRNNKIESWIISEELANSNGIFYSDGELIVGNSNRSILQAIDLKTKTIRTIASLGRGIIDGIRKDTNGDLLVSIWEGDLYRISPSGEITRILYSEGQFNIADFEYIKSRRMFIIPGFLKQSIIAFEYLH
jgi:hypothetical protein